LLTVPEINAKVRRRYSDFAWLRENLEEFYPGHFVKILNNNIDSSNSKKEIRRQT
jgi:hypothetical protein